MKIQPEAGPAAIAVRQRGFSLPEVMVTATLSMLIVGGLMTSYLFGLHLFAFTKPKLRASDDARVFIGDIVNELRSAHLIRVGQGGRTTFNEVPFGARQEGNAVQIYPTTNLTEFVRYYHDPDDQALKRLESSIGVPRIIASSVTNHLVFSSEDASGQVLTNNQNNRVIGLALQFHQIQYPIMKIGPDEFYDYYQVRTKVTRRTLF
ncbi:MAG: PilW family protein [Verrucomicrobiia bacterium]